ncbi:MAG: hypothetical protein QOF99_2599, partial [Pseudonocardiales bacterium]|nr:hypothetical protein [Pseudonocardiales bacterium]
MTSAVLDVYLSESDAEAELRSD